DLDAVCDDANGPRHSARTPPNRSSIGPLVGARREERHHAGLSLAPREGFHPGRRDGMPSPEGEITVLRTPLDRFMLAFRMKTPWPIAWSLRPMRLLPQTISGRAPVLSPTGRQLMRFCVVGASGYGVNLLVYASLLAAGVGYVAAAAVSFLVAASSNYALNRCWTFEAKQERLASQGLRALAVSAMSLGANQISLLALVAAGADHLGAQAV